MDDGHGSCAVRDMVFKNGRESALARWFPLIWSLAFALVLPWLIAGGGGDEDSDAAMLQFPGSPSDSSDSMFVAWTLKRVCEAGTVPEKLKHSHIDAASGLLLVVAASFGFGFWVRVVPEKAKQLVSKYMGYDPAWAKKRAAMIKAQGATPAGGRGADVEGGIESFFVFCTC